MAVDACSYLVSLISLLLIRTPEPRVSRPQRGQLRNDLREGLAFILHNRYLRAVALVAAMCNFFTTATQSMFILYAVEDRGLSPGTLGLTLSVGAVGGIVGAAAAGSLIRRFPLGRVYAGSLVMAFCAPVLIPAADGSKLLVTATFMASLCLGYCGVSLVNVIIMSLRQTVTPPPLMGRMNAAMRTLMIGMAALGGPAAGFFAEAVGVREALWAAAAGSAAVVVPVLMSPVWRLRTMPPAPEAEVTPAPADLVAA